MLFFIFFEPQIDERNIDLELHRGGCAGEQYTKEEDHPVNLNPSIKLATTCCDGWYQNPLPQPPLRVLATSGDGAAAAMVNPA